MKTKNNPLTAKNNLNDFLLVEKEFMEKMSSTLMSGQKQQAKIALDLLNIVTVNIDKLTSSSDFFLLDSKDKRTALFNKNAEILKDILTNMKANSFFMNNIVDEEEFEKQAKKQFEKFYETIVDFILINQSGLDNVLKRQISAMEFFNLKMEETGGELSESARSFSDALQNVVDKFFVNWTPSLDRNVSNEQELSDQLIGGIDTLFNFWTDLMKFNNPLQVKKHGIKKGRKSTNIHDELNNKKEIKENSLQH